MRPPLPGCGQRHWHPVPDGGGLHRNGPGTAGCDAGEKHNKKKPPLMQRLKFGYDYLNYMHFIVDKPAMVTGVCRAIITIKIICIRIALA